MAGVAAMLAGVAATALSYEQDRPHRLPSLHPAHDIRFDYAWTHKDDGPPEPRWRGQRVVGISQGTTGTHATFEAVSKLGLPAAHWFYQHRAGEEQRTTSILMRETPSHALVADGPSIFPAHDAVLALYDAAGDCAAAADGDECDLVPDKWAKDIAKAMEYADRHGYSMFDVPYAAVPRLTAASTRGTNFLEDGTLFVRMMRNANDWATSKVENHAMDDGPVCNRTLWAKDFSPLDVHTCALKCASEGLPGAACFEVLVRLPHADIREAYERNEAELDTLYPEAFKYDLFSGAHHVEKSDEQIDIMADAILDVLQGGDPAKKKKKKKNDKDVAMQKVGRKTEKPDDKKPPHHAPPKDEQASELKETSAPEDQAGGTWWKQHHMWYKKEKNEKAKAKHPSEEALLQKPEGCLEWCDPCKAMQSLPEEEGGCPISDAEMCSDEQCKGCGFCAK
jgi:hypothetical protein